MENIDEILKTVILSQLLAESLGELADKLGYKGRSTFYRIINGDASERAIAGICQKLKDRLFVNEDALGCMDTTIFNTSRFRKIVRPYIKPKGPHSACEVVDAFVSKDFSMFPEAFKHACLEELLDLERTDPDAFYTMLAYFYYNASGLDYYAVGETHRERSARILEALGETFIRRYPENSLAAGCVYLYSKSELFNGEAPILWSLIKTLAIVLKMFSRPIETLERDIRFFSLLNEREYWEGNDKGEIILTSAAADLKPGGNYYEIFRISRESGHIGYIGYLCFLSDEIVSFYSASRGSAILGMYDFDGHTFSMEWEDPKANPTTLGDKWNLLDRNYSQNLRSLDKSVSKDRLCAEKLKAQGWSELTGYKVTDVIISRERLTLTLINGKSLSISISEAPFLQKLRPEYLILIYVRESDNVPFVCWPEIMHCLPLDYFTES